MDERRDHRRRGVARLDAPPQMRLELRHQAQRGERAGDQQLARRQVEPAPGVEVAEGVLGEQPRGRLAEAVGQPRHGVRDLVAVERRLDRLTTVVTVGVRGRALVGQRQLDAPGGEHLVEDADRVERAREAEERRQLVERLARLDGRGTHMERCPEVRLELRQRLHARQHRDGDQLAGAVVEVAGGEDVAEDQGAEDASELGIGVGGRRVARSEEPGVDVFAAFETVAHACSFATRLARSYSASSTGSSQVVGSASPSRSSRAK